MIHSPSDFTASHSPPCLLPSAPHCSSGHFINMWSKSFDLTRKLYIQKKFSIGTVPCHFLQVIVQTSPHQWNLPWKYYYKAYSRIHSLPSFFILFFLHSFYCLLWQSFSHLEDNLHWKRIILTLFCSPLYSHVEEKYLV